MLRDTNSPLTWCWGWKGNGGPMRERERERECVCFLDNVVRSGVGKGRKEGAMSVSGLAR